MPISQNFFYANIKQEDLKKQPFIIEEALKRQFPECDIESDLHETYIDYPSGANQTFEHSVGISEWLSDPTPTTIIGNLDNMVIMTHAERPNNFDQLNLFPNVDMRPNILKRFGIEIECLSESGYVDISNSLSNHDIYNDYDTRNIDDDEWEITDDSSIRPKTSWENGYEIRSPILMEDQVDEQVTNVCKALEDVSAEINQTCGLHIHIDGRPFTLKEKAKIAAQYVRNQKTIDSIMEKQRHHNTHARGWDEDWAKQIIQDIPNVEDLEDVQMLVNPRDRYHKINFRTYQKGTIEFRQHQGTTYYKDIIQWKNFVTAFVEYARRNDFPATNTRDDLHELIHNLAEHLPTNKQKAFTKHWFTRHDWLIRHPITEDSEYDYYYEDDDDYEDDDYEDDDDYDPDYEPEF